MPRAPWLRPGSSWCDALRFSSNGNRGGGCCSARDLRLFIENNTEVVSDHLTPEIKLRLLTPRCRFWTERADRWPFSDPYWAIYWPGGQALSRYLLDNQEIAKGKTVLDLGSGCGASAIAASMSEAASVLANDTDPIAAVTIEMNCKLNTIRSLPVVTRNMIGKKSEEKWDLILLGDMFYDEELAARLHGWLTKCKSFRKTNVLIGDPGRTQFLKYAAKNQLEKVAEYELLQTTKEQNYGLTTSGVWRYTTGHK